MNAPENILPHHGEVLYYPQFFSSAESEFYFRHLQENIDWKQEPITIFGKTVMQPRLTALYGDPHKSYSYSGITMHPHAWTDDLLQIKNKIENIAGTEFTIVLLNYYRDGNDSMGWHRDNEKSLGKNPVIASLSFGVSRNFQLRDYTNKNAVQTLMLEQGSLLVMRGETQHYWEHRVPKAVKQTGSRINLTFRVLK